MGYTSYVSGSETLIKLFKQTKSPEICNNDI